MDQLPSDQECGGDNEVNSVTSHSEETRQVSSSVSRSNVSNDPSSIATIHESHPSDVSNINKNNSENLKQNDAINVNTIENLSFGGNGHEDGSDKRNKENYSNEDVSSDERNKENVSMDGGTTNKNVSSNNTNEDGNISSDDGDKDESDGADNSEEEIDNYFSEGELESIYGSPPKDESDSQQKISENSRLEFPLGESEEGEGVSSMPQSMGVECTVCTAFMPSNASLCEVCGHDSNSINIEEQRLQRIEQEMALLESFAAKKESEIKSKSDGDKED